MGAATVLKHEGSLFFSLLVRRLSIEGLVFDLCMTLKSSVT